MTRFEQCLKTVLKSEGGLVNHPKDPGGLTNLGVTRKTWEAWKGRGVTEAEMSGLTPADVAPLYLQRYWNASSANKLPVGLDLLVFDHAVNAGPGRAVRMLQTVLGVAPDGIFGCQSMDALKGRSVMDLLHTYSAYRESYYRSLPTFGVFGRGWLRRVKDTLQEAMAYVEDS